MGVPCPICEKIISNTSNLKEHIRIHSGEKPFKCDLCTQSFNNKGNLNKHKKKHSNLPYPCDHCDRSFRNRSQLTCHEKNRKKPYEHGCHICCQSYQFKSGLEKHLSDIHQTTISEWEKQGKTVEPTPESTHSKMKPTTSKVNLGEEEEYDIEDPATQGPRVNIGSRGSSKRKTIQTKLQSSKKNKTELGGTEKETDNTKETEAINDDDDEDFFYKTQVSPKRKVTTSNATSVPLAKSVSFKSVKFQESQNVNVATSKDIDDNDPEIIPGTQCLPNEEDVCNRFDQNNYDEEGSGYGNIANSMVPFSINSSVVEATLGSVVATAYSHDQDENDSRSYQNTSPSPESTEIQSDATYAKIGGCSTSFILQTWRFQKNQDEVLKIKNSIPFLRFLRGDKIEMDINEMALFLQSKPEAILGKFPVAIFIIDSVLNKYKLEVKKLYEIRKTLPEEFCSIIEHLTFYQFHLQIRENCSSSTALEGIPHSIIQEFCFDYLRISMYGQKDYKIVTMQESKCLPLILEHLFELIYKECTSAELLATDYKKDMDRLRLWTLLTSKFISGFIKKDYKNFFELILMMDLENNVGTQTYFSVKYDGKTIPAMFHQEIIARHAVSATPSKKVLETTFEDLKTFTDLLYCDYNVMKLKGKITIGVYLMTMEMKIKNVSGFLFRNNSFSDFITEENKRDIFHILIYLKMEKEIQEIVNMFDTFFSVAEQSKALNGLPAETVVILIGSKLERLGEFDKYKMLIQWAFSKCDKKCEDEMDVGFKDDAYEHFLQVRKVIRILDLEPFMGQILSQGYIKYEDFQKAKIMSFINDRSNQSLPQEIWWTSQSREK